MAEGWGLYSERLADEMGLYTSDVDRLGMLSNEALRAARLVVDPGMHVLGWTREQAIDYMLENTAENRNSVEGEVDRYIAVPGQATAYMTGSLEIQRLRAEAEAAPGRPLRHQGLPRYGAEGRCGDAAHAARGGGAVGGGELVGKRALIDRDIAGGAGAS